MADEPLEPLSADEVTSYQSYITGLAQGAVSSDVVFYIHPGHAAIIIESLLRGARMTFDVLTGGLYRAVYAAPSVVEAAISFLSDGAAPRIRMLSEAPIDIGSHLLLATVVERGLGSRFYSGVVPKDLQSEYQYHFALADRRSYGFRRSRETPESVAQFGGLEFAAKLGGIFDSLADRVHLKPLS